MAADAKGVYSALFDSLDGQGSLIRIAPQHDFAPQLGLTTLAENQWAPGSVVLDETNVYWSTAGTRMNQIVRGSICKLHK